ncbi:hypothetical protein [Aquimonas sp.]|jgi:hypothetical protein|uniref:hypothetical protein n=1 Tax=Aquimonas sp. TaxID=1872588 RepID=UPI0037BF388B
MGYSLYITRREDWSDPSGPEIALREWFSLVESDLDLRWEPVLGEHFAVFADSSEADTSWLTWESGNLESKHPTKAMISKMHSVAELLSARLVGEEGEGYDRHGNEAPVPLSPAQPAARIIWRRVQAFFSRPQAEDPGLPIGSRVRDPWGRTATVSGVDLRAENGLGCIVIRYDDGRVSRFTAVAHGLEKLGVSASGI